MASPSEPPSKAISQLRARLPTYLSKTTSTIAHLNRLLSRTSALDTTLLTTTYTLHLLHSLLTKSPRLSLMRLTTTLGPLTALIDEFRVFLRLWGLLSIYSWGTATYLSPPGDAVTTCITWAQVAACAVFQALENGAYLAQRGVLGWDNKATARAWAWSSRAWMAHVALELARLGYEWQHMRGRDWARARRKSMRVEEAYGRANLEKADVEGEETRKSLGEEKGELELREEKGELELREEKVEEEMAAEKWAKWQRELGVSAAYAPMTVHYSLEQGPLGEGSLGALGVVVGWLSIGRAWRDSA